eukprot:643778-Pelagomonas_calceolata.AAC.1
MAATSSRQASPAHTTSPTFPPAASAASCPGCTSSLPGSLVGSSCTQTTFGGGGAWITGI